MKMKSMGGVKAPKKPAMPSAMKPKKPAMPMPFKKGGMTKGKKGC